jgi:hypothetical protein
MLVLKQTNDDLDDLAVKVVQTTCNTTEQPAIDALERIDETVRRRVQINKTEISVLRDSFP